MPSFAAAINPLTVRAAPEVSMEDAPTAGTHASKKKEDPNASQQKPANSPAPGGGGGGKKKKKGKK